MIRDAKLSDIPKMIEISKSFVKSNDPNGIRVRIDDNRLKETLEETLEDHISMAPSNLRPSYTRTIEIDGEMVSFLCARIIPNLLNYELSVFELAWMTNVDFKKITRFRACMSLVRDLVVWTKKQNLNRIHFTLTYPSRSIEKVLKKLGAVELERVYALEVN